MQKQLNTFETSGNRTMKFKHHNPIDVTSNRNVFESQWLTPNGVNWVISQGFRLGMHHAYVTPEIARYLLDNYGYDAQRNTRDGNVKYFAKEMKASRFLPITQILFCFDHTLQKWVMIDGQHRLKSIIVANEGQFFWVQLIDTKYSSVGEIYSVVDTGGMRTIPDVLKPLTDMSIRGARPGSMIAAVRYIIGGFTKAGRISPLELSLAISEWKPYISMYANAVLGGIMVDKLRSAPFLALGAITFKYQADRAHEFWNPISHMTGLMKGDPRWLFYNQLIKKNSDFNTTGGQQLANVGRYGAYIWNKYYAHESLSKMPTITDTRVAVNGTPYDTAKPNMGL